MTPSEAGERWNTSSFATRLLALESCRVPDASRPGYARLDWASLPSGLQRLLLPHLGKPDPLDPLEWDCDKASGGCGAPARSPCINADGTPAEVGVCYYGRGRMTRAARFAAKVARGEDEP